MGNVPTSPYWSAAPGRIRPTCSSPARSKSSRSGACSSTSSTSPRCRSTTTPLWNDPPAEVLDLKQRIAEADAVLFVTPEYNRSIPGALKNAIDWPSRPFGQSVWEGKPAAIVGATAAVSGTAAAQAPPALDPRCPRHRPDGPAGSLLHSKTRHDRRGLSHHRRQDQEFLGGWVTKFTGFIGHFVVRTRLFLGKWVDAFVTWIGKVCRDSARPQDRRRTSVLSAPEPRTGFNPVLPSRTHMGSRTVFRRARAAGASPPAPVACWKAAPTRSCGRCRPGEMTIMSAPVGCPGAHSSHWQKRLQIGARNSLARLNRN